MLIWWLAHIFLLINPPQSNVDHSLGQNRMKQQTPTHPKNEAAQKPKRAIFPSLELIGRGGGGGRVLGGRGGGGGKKFQYRLS